MRSRLRVPAHAPLPAQQTRDSSVRIPVLGETDHSERTADAATDSVLNTPVSPARTNGSRSSLVAPATSAVAKMFGSTGAPLDAATRAFMEPRFGRDFSAVRVHTDHRAAQSARALGARAYTLGSDIVFHPGQHAPRTREGRQLLAHELAHVVQQQHRAPAIQRKLFATGSIADIKAMFNLLEPASGLTLQHNRKTGEVTIVASVLKPQSSVLAAELLTIMMDEKQHAHINVGRTQSQVFLGGFPDLKGKAAANITQQIRIDHMLAFEKGAPGSGVASLAHEIIENYHANADENVISEKVMDDAESYGYLWESAFLSSHRKATDAQNLIETELGHPGGRSDFFFVHMGKGAREFLRGIRDHESYFMILDSKGDNISNVRRVPRVRVASFEIDPTGNPGSAARKHALDSVADAMIKEPSATVRLEGQISVFDAPRPDLTAPKAWADAALKDLDKSLDSKTGDVEIKTFRRKRTEADFTRGKSRIVITVDRPDM
jgi:Domain of unknown function (DUF4157)